VCYGLGMLILASALKSAEGGHGFNLAQVVENAGNEEQTINNFRRIGVAVHNFHDIYQAFPTSSTDASGQPLLSWRVRILPYLDEQTLYAQFHLDEPWNSPHNSTL